MKRLFDLIIALPIFLLVMPILGVFALAIWLEDRHSPFYTPSRIGKSGQSFKMFKLRSMIVEADKSGVDSTSSDDKRITAVGKILRQFKVDELMQLVNVILGDMSLVGPRPNVKRETDLYTDIEARLLDVKPGITDFASIVFSDEGGILAGSTDPDLAYNQLIRPGKSLLGLFYIEKQSLTLDFLLCLLTAANFFKRSWTLKTLCKLLARCGASADLVELASRKKELQPSAPPGADALVVSRKYAIK